MDIQTLTMNPVLDINTSTDLITPGKKLRCGKPSYAPGGGGLNISRAISKLGGTSSALLLAGGENGQRISDMLKEEGIEHHAIESGANTRENFIVYDEQLNYLYRFGMPGPDIDADAWKQIIPVLDKQDPKPGYLAASGSLPPGVPDDFYAQIARWAKENEVRFILDTSGEPLRKALEEGVYMIKPNLREMAQFLGKDRITGMEQEQAILDIIQGKQAEMVLLSLGAKGAVLAHDYDIIEYVTPPSMPVESAVGAGDSMVAGFVLGLTRGLRGKLALEYGVSAGTAATMTAGSELCKRDDTEKIFNWLKEKQYA